MCKEYYFNTKGLDKIFFGDNTKNNFIYKKKQRRFTRNWDLQVWLVKINDDDGQLNTKCKTINIIKFIKNQYANLTSLLK